MRTDRRLIAGLFLWLVSILVVGTLVLQNPTKRTVTKVYHKSTESWLQARPLYSDCGNLNYLPPFAVLFLPFHLLPLKAGDILWRLISLSLFVWGLYRLAGRLHPAPGQIPWLFLFLTLLTLLPVLGSLRNGQTNLIFSALVVHMAASLAVEGWWTAALSIVAMTLVKPTGVVLLLLAPFLYLRLLPRLLVLLPAGLLLPFLFAPPHYVMSQYRECVVHLATCSATTEHRFADMNGLLRSISIELPIRFSQWMRVAAGAVTLLAWLVFGRRMREPSRALFLMALSTVYLMLFNPMTETNSYSIVAPTLAAYAAVLISVERRVAAGLMPAAAVLSISILPEALRRLLPTLGLWWDPLMMILFLGMLPFVFRAGFLTDRRSNGPGSN
jgi:alpha-1,2-mannosyltransferase